MILLSTWKYSLKFYAFTKTMMLLIILISIFIDFILLCKNCISSKNSKTIYSVDLYFVDLEVISKNIIPYKSHLHAYIP